MQTIIRARGICSGEVTDVMAEFRDGEFLRISFDGKPNFELEMKFRRMMENPPLVGGTYTPPPYTSLAAYGILVSNFFDGYRNLGIEVEGELEEIPSYDIEGIVY